MVWVFGLSQGIPSIWVRGQWVTKYCGTVNNKINMAHSYIVKSINFNIYCTRYGWSRWRAGYGSSRGNIIIWFIIINGYIYWSQSYLVAGIVLDVSMNGMDYIIYFFKSIPVISIGWFLISHHRIAINI